MTRFEDCFPPDIVQAVYARLEQKAAKMTPTTASAQTKVIDLATYRKRVVSAASDDRD